MLDMREVVSRRGQKLLDARGDKIGKIEEIYEDRETGEPTWVLVNTGFFGSGSSFVPLAQARIQDDDLRVAYDKDKIKDAPRFAPDRELSEQEEAELYRHYGLDYGRPSRRGFDGRRETDRDGRGRVDDAMTRSEEELRIGKVRHETGRVRLRKYVVTEQVQRTVPVTREEVRVEREPISERNADRALRGPEISEDEHEIVLHAEEPVVEKRVVPKERVRLGTETITEERRVADQVRKEKIEVDPEGRR